jgi:tetratricopeptide (TPR) repeat protein
LISLTQSLSLHQIKHKGKNDEAIKDYDEVIRLNPNHSNALNKRGSLKYSQNLFQEAIMDYDKVIQYHQQQTKLVHHQSTF